MADINIIPSQQLDKAKWDACVANSSNGLIYAYSYYLDAMANEWHGLVVNDYETIFPMAIRKKWGFSYCYMPAFIQQLGFIGKEIMLDAEIKSAIFSFVKYGSPYLNFSNNVFAEQNHCPSLSNYIIDLNKDYKAIKQSYKKSIDYSLSKAAKQGMDYVVDNDIATALSLYKEHNKLNMLHVTDEDYSKLGRLLLELQKTNQVIIRKAIDTNKQLLSIALLLKDNKRFYNLINYTTDQGRKLEANYFLYDNILREFSAQPMLFDFEGSDLPGVKSFYEKFGAVNQPYFHWHFNNLPLPLRLLKK
jgi:hypothetical protein